ncbi:Hypothetical protein FKW44_022011 [Caligus rogercresseyi]|uniref:Uncharacterized protein n=1 Tax=Caligus rogercresseyi TaxID=217165 RepID=A0A7T8GS63_CALRO|nr:Hypothetical protein FKW44_022011 [Caligus rogercresseyi]
MSFKLIAAAPRSPEAYCQDKTSNNTILSPATNHNDTHHSFMRRAVVYPPIPAVSFPGGSTCPTSTLLKQSTISTVAAGACHEDTTQATLHRTGERLPSPTHSRKADRTPPRPRLHWPHSSRHSKSILGN